MTASLRHSAPPKGSNLKLISRRDIRKLGEIVLSGFNYLENLDSPRKFPRRSTAKWMHPGAPSGFHPIRTHPIADLPPPSTTPSTTNDPHRSGVLALRPTNYMSV